MQFERACKLTLLWPPKFARPARLAKLVRPAWLAGLAGPRCPARVLNLTAS